jgi:hypothetical protein
MTWWNGERIRAALESWPDEDKDWHAPPYLVAYVEDFVFEGTPLPDYFDEYEVQAALDKYRAEHEEEE